MTQKTIPKLKTRWSISMGCDPELFFSYKNKIIGSEKIIPRKGLTYKYSDNDPTENKVVRDGVQLELHPFQQPCRVFLGNNISRCFEILKHELNQKNEPELKLDLSTTIKIDKKELRSLEPENQVLGCEPSLNIYRAKNTMSIKNGATYFYRSAGGHIHIGNTNPFSPNIARALKDPKTLIPLLDLIVGNTCVLLDQNTGNIQRRKIYGKAGEYRLPRHGIEYRTLSNFWIQNYKLMSLVMGLTRFTVNILANSTQKYNYAKKILKLVPRRDIKRAINTNSFDLAMKNFKKIEKYMLDITPDNDTGYPLTHRNIKNFHYFITKGTKFWFKKPLLEHWTDQPTRKYGWEGFLAVRVNKYRLKDKNHNPT